MKEQRQQDLSPGEGEQILVVDDNMVCADMCREMLQFLGYKVTAMTDPCEALKAFRREPQRFSLLLTDNDMPHLGGIELAKQIKALCPGLPILSVSASLSNISQEDRRRLPFDRYLRKPFGLVEMSCRIRELLQEMPRPGKGTTEAP